MAITKDPSMAGMSPDHVHRSSQDRQKRFFTHLIVYAAVNIGLCALNLLKNPDHLWFYWVAFGWGLGIIFHGIRAFTRKD